MGYLRSLSFFFCENTRRGTRKGLQKKGIKSGRDEAENRRAISESQRRNDDQQRRCWRRSRNFQDEHQERGQESSTPKKAQREKSNNDYSRECQATWRSCRTVYSKKQGESTLKANKEMLELSTWWNAVWNQGRKRPKVSLTELYVMGQFTEDREEWQKNYKGTVKRCTLTWRKQKTFR